MAANNLAHSDNWTFYVVPLLILIPLVYKLRRRSKPSGSRQPPSPWALPVIGHIHHLVGALPHQAMRDVAKRLGAPLMLLRLCEQRVVVASSTDAAREIMRTHGVAFASRPMNPTGKILLGDGAGSYGLVFAPYGEEWRQLRRICTTELFSTRRVRSFRSVREDEVRRLIRSVVASSSGTGTGRQQQAVNLNKLIAAYVGGASVRAIIGNRFKDRETFMRLLDQRMEIIPGESLPDLFPSSRLAMLVSRMPRRAKQERDNMIAFLDTMIREHQHQAQAAGRCGGDDDEDLLDVLLRVQREQELDPPLTTENIKSVIIDIFAAGAEPAATTLQWAMAELMRNPRVMRKAQDEVRRVLGVQKQNNNVVEEEKLGDLHYLRLIIKETLRLHPPTPLLLPRECGSPCQVLGFDVPVGATVVVNVWAIGRDPAYWDSPEEFMPERFDKTGIDFLGTDFEFIPFGAGKRICPGMVFGMANMELALASLLYHFDWELPDGTAPCDLDMAESPGLAVRRRDDLWVVPAVRVPLPVD